MRQAGAALAGPRRGRARDLLRRARDVVGESLGTGEIVGQGDRGHDRRRRRSPGVGTGATCPPPTRSDAGARRLVVLRNLVVAALALGAALTPPRTRAGTDTDQLAVSATVVSSCSLSGGSLAFGQYVAGQATDLDVTGAIDYANCSGTLSFALDGGGSGSVGARQMSAGSNRLAYQVYRDSARSRIWGAGADARVLNLSATQSGTVPVYGRVPKDQAVPAGTYSDVVNITLTF